MKRIILLVTLLLAASGCATTTEAPSNNAPTPSANTATSATPKAATTAADSDVAAKEREIWDAIKKKDSAAFAAMLADDFTYITDDGVYDKAGTVNGVKQLELTDVTFSDWKTVMLDKDAAVVTYTVKTQGTSGGQPIPATPVRGSSVWVNRGGKWVGVFHQETYVEPAPPDTEDTAGNKPAATATTPATSPTGAQPAEPVADDPIAREKQVWDAIKKKDYDRFASFLAEDQIEVFGWGVNDKAASVKGVQQVDLSKATLSDFKTVKLSDAATAVIYTAKGPTPPFGKEGERNSTIWVNRGGKWLAAFHQSTAVKAAQKK
jgi:hypothetical protein